VQKERVRNCAACKGQSRLHRGVERRALVGAIGTGSMFSFSSKGVTLDPLGTAGSLCSARLSRPSRSPPLPSCAREVAGDRFAMAERCSSGVALKLLRGNPARFGAVAGDTFVVIAEFFLDGQPALRSAAKVVRAEGAPRGVSSGFRMLRARNDIFQQYEAI